jgi:hypothetical protein
MSSSDQMRGYQQSRESLSFLAIVETEADQTRPIDVSEHWSTALLQEWAVQASLETALDLPVSVSLGVDATLQAKGQIGFIDLFCQGLFRIVSDILPGKSLLGQEYRLLLTVIPRNAALRRRLCGQSSDMANPPQSLGRTTLFVPHSTRLPRRGPRSTITNPLPTPPTSLPSLAD